MPVEPGTYKTGIWTAAAIARRPGSPYGPFAEAMEPRVRESVERIRDSLLREVVITDTIPLPPTKQLRKIKQLSVAPLIGEAISRIHTGGSVGALFGVPV